MEAIPHLLVMYVVLLPLWALIASPVLVGFFVLARLMRRRSVRSTWGIVAFALAFSLLAAPVPTPIITVLLPHGLALLDRSYYPNIFQGPAMLADLWWWIIPSLVLAFAVSLVAAWRYIRSGPPDDSLKPNPLRGSTRSWR